MKLDDKYFVHTEEKQPNTIEDLLTEGEHILWQGAPKKGAYIAERVLRMLPAALIWLLFDGAFIVVMCLFVTGIPAPVIAFLVVFFMLHLTPVWIWLHGIITASARLKQTHYVFTDQRIIIQSGFIGKNISIIYYSELTGVNLTIGIIDRMYKVGDIYLTAADKREVLEDISDPYFVTSRLQKIAHDIKTDIEYPNDLRPAGNSGYHTEYNE